MKGRSAVLVSVLCLAAASSSPAQVLTPLYSFCSQSGCDDGLYPLGLLVQGSDGNLYGTTYGGGTAGYGTIFKMTPQGGLTVLHSLTGLEDGAEPYAGVIQGTDGNLYGVDTIGGNTPSGCGAAFKVTTAGTLTWLHRFAGYPKDGCTAWGPLVQANDGNLYGTTSGGGTYNLGAVFKMTAGGSVTLLYSFTGQSDGSNPLAGLMQGTDGYLYGEANLNGAHGYGTIFKISLSGAFTTVHSFNLTDGYQPDGGLIQGSDGNYYGTTSSGGVSTYFQNAGGTIFKLTPGGALTTLYNFCSQPGCADGHAPYAGLTKGKDGNFYGTTYLGGTANDGTIFSISPSGTFVSLYSFCTQSKCADGVYPYAGVIQASDGKFYGVTKEGGPSNYGVAFSFTPPPIYTLSIARNGSGTVTSSDNDINCGSTCSYQYRSGSQVTLTATPSSGWVFTSWNGCDNVNGNVCTVTMNNNRTATATFTQTYQLTVTKTGNGTVTSGDGHINCGSTCTYTYQSGTVVTLTATPDQYWVFTSWSGCDQVNGNVCTVTINNNRTVTATFTATYQLTVSDTGNGSVTSSDGYINCGSSCSHTYLTGSVVNLTATPGSGWGFAAWSGCDQSRANICLVVMNANRTVTATFKVLYSLSVNKIGTGGVSSADGYIYCGSTCSSLYMDGTLVTLSAIPAAGYTFSSWAGCDNVNGSFCYVTVSSARNVSATFSAVNNILLTSLLFKPSYVKGGWLSAGTLTLNGAVPPGGLTIALSSDHPGVAHPPAFVVVPGGKTSVQFAVQTFPVKNNTTVTITATEGLSHVSGTLTVGTTSLPPLLK